MDAHNFSNLKKLEKPICKIEAVNMGNARGLSPELGLCNGSLGVVKDILYNEGTQPPALPAYVWVKFSDYIGGPILDNVGDIDRSKWIPIAPVKVVADAQQRNSEQKSRTMLRIRLKEDERLRNLAENYILPDDEDDGRGIPGDVLANQETNGDGDDDDMMLDEL